MPINEVLKELLLSGLTPAEVFRSHPEFPISRIRTVRKRLGLPKILAGTWKRVQSAESISARAVCRHLKIEGMTYQQIGEIMGFSRQRAGQLLQTDRHSHRSGPCTKCGRHSDALHRHHSNYVTDETELLCVSCHRKITTTELAKP